MAKVNIPTPILGLIGTAVAIATVIVSTWALVAFLINPRFDDVQGNIVREVNRVYNHIDNHVQSDIDALKEDVDDLKSAESQAHKERDALAKMIVAQANGEDAETIAGIWEIVSGDGDDES